MADQRGLAHLAHHKLHWEYCYSYTERANYIRTRKALNEQATRLTWFVIVPAERLPVSVREAVAVVDEAWAKRMSLAADYWAKLESLAADYGAKRKSLDADDAAKRKSLDADYMAKRKPLDADYRAKRMSLDANYMAKRKSLDAALIACAGEMDALHAELFPGCPWNGGTMFPEKGGA